MNQDTARAVARSFQDSRHSWVHIISLHVVLSFKMNWKVLRVSNSLKTSPQRPQVPLVQLLAQENCLTQFLNHTLTDRSSKKAQRQQIWWKKSPWCICSGVGNSMAILIFAAVYNLRLDLQPYDDCVLFWAWLLQKLNGTFTTDPQVSC